MALLEKFNTVVPEITVNNIARNISIIARILCLLILIAVEDVSNRCFIPFSTK